MAWVAFDRAVKAIERYGLPGPVDEWRATRTRIHAEICEHGFDKERNTFRSAYGETTLDASLLLMAQVGFIEPKDPRFLGTIAAIERELLVDGFVKRYNTHETDDGLAPGEGAFLACSFWLADAYCSVGRWDDADKMLGRLLSIRNDLGLAGRGIRHRERPPDRQLPAGLLACRPDQHLLQPDPRHPSGRAARQGQRLGRSGAGSAQEAAASRQGPEKMAEPGGHHVRRRAPSSTAR